MDDGIIINIRVAKLDTFGERTDPSAVSGTSSPGGSHPDRAFFDEASGDLGQ
jgi:hypothetical protein